MVVTIANFFLEHTLGINGTICYQWYTALPTTIVIVAILSPIILWAKRHFPIMLGEKCLKVCKIQRKTLNLHQKMESELRELQLKCLEILDIVVKICTEHNIKYSLCGGSVVGAHLYKGFLPWDDDIDIMMTRDNYNKCKRIQTINIGKKNASNINNWLRNLSLSTILSNRRKYLIFFQKVAELFGKHSRHYTYRELFGAYHGYNMVPYKPSIFENYTTIEFEGRKVMIVRDYIDYLKTRYNRTDFNEPEERQVPSHYAYVNFNLPYKEHIKQQSI